MWEEELKSENLCEIVYYNAVPSGVPVILSRLFDGGEPAVRVGPAYVVAQFSETARSENDEILPFPLRLPVSSTLIHLSKHPLFWLRKF